MMEEPSLFTMENSNDGGTNNSIGEVEREAVIVVEGGDSVNGVNNNNSRSAPSSPGFERARSTENNSEEDIFYSDKEEDKSESSSVPSSLLTLVRSLRNERVRNKF